jgi:hypothetical protein
MTYYIVFALNSHECKRQSEVEFFYFVGSHENTFPDTKFQNDKRYDEMKMIFHIIRTIPNIINKS